jgi:hypothetical protein
MSETREEVDAVDLLRGAWIELLHVTPHVRWHLLMDALKVAAGMDGEGDGLVVLRYEGDAVTVAGRLEDRVGTFGPRGPYRLIAPPAPRSAR